MKKKYRIGCAMLIAMGVMVNSLSMMYAATSDANKYVTMEEVKALLQSQKLEMYPVGSIYMSTSNTNPSSLFGGTWVAWGSGRVPVGVNTSDGNFNTVEKTGGESTHILTTAEMPSHTHTFTGKAVTSGGNSVTPTATFTGKSVTTGNNSVTPTASFTGKAVNTGNQSAGHTHSIPSLSGSTNSAGAHTHTGSGKTGTGEASWMRVVGQVGTNSGAGQIPGWSSGNYTDLTTTTDFPGANHVHSYSFTTSENGAHSHSVSTTASTSGGISANHTHSVTAAGSVSLASTTHTHSVTASGTVSLASTSHTHSVTASGTNSSTGNGSAHNNLQPYITCYMWKRTA